MRNDIPCGIETCTICPSAQKSLLNGFENAGLSSLVSRNHYVIVDLGIMLHKADVLDDECFKYDILTVGMLANRYYGYQVGIQKDWK